eukprot:GHRR01031996.1.p1 GENE.GHRR01031996.1~~GHRR01031996.1.p1  ORF type:complete len:107 (+),score=47.89 GHRR01031996.1:207-527(+)
MQEWAGHLQVDSMHANAGQILGHQQQRWLRQGLQLHVRSEHPTSNLTLQQLQLERTSPMGRLLPTSSGGRSAAAEALPTVYVIDSHLTDRDFPRFYKAGDAFVLPT